MLYFQSLTPAKFATLTRTDRYIYDSYFVSLISAYAENGGDAQELMKQLQNEGVNFSRYYKQSPETSPVKVE